MSLSLNYVCTSVHLWLRVNKDTMQNSFIILKPCVNVRAHGTILLDTANTTAKPLKTMVLAREDILIFFKE